MTFPLSSDLFLCNSTPPRYSDPSAFLRLSRINIPTMLAVDDCGCTPFLSCSLFLAVPTFNH